MRTIKERQELAATAGTTPTFIRAALLVAERGDQNRLDDELLASAIHELREGSDQLTSALLGAQAAR